MNCQRCLGEIIFPQCLTDQLSTQHEPLNSTQQVLPAALRPPRHSPSCEEAAFEMMGLSENTQLLLSFRGQPQSLFDWREDSYAEQLISVFINAWGCLSLPRVCPAGTLLCSSPHNLMEASLNLCRGVQDGSGCGWDCAGLWLRKPLRFVVPIAFSFSHDSGYAPGQGMCQCHPCPPSHLLSTW